MKPVDLQPCASSIPGAGNGCSYQQSAVPAIKAGKSIKAVIQSNSQLWDLYTLAADYSKTGKAAYQSYFSGGHPESLQDPALSRYLHGKMPAPNYPDGKKFAVCLSHDVDVVYPPLTHRAISSLYHLKQGNFMQLKNEVLWRKGGKSAYDYKNFLEIMAIEERYGARSSFYFLTADRNIQRFRIYDIEGLESELGYISDQGWEVGLHGGYYSYDDVAAIKSEKRRLEKVLGRSVCGFRNHWLCFKVPDTWEHLKAAGFRYDTTLGYNNVPGFRNGMCHPFRPFNRNTGREMDIIEIPLAIMDVALFGYAGTPYRAWEVAKRLIDTAERYNGVITLLWHNDSFYFPYRADWMALYLKILKYCHEKNAWMTGGDEISRLCD